MILTFQPRVLLIDDIYNYLDVFKTSKETSQMTSRMPSTLVSSNNFKERMMIPRFF